MEGSHRLDVDALLGREMDTVGTYVTDLRGETISKLPLDGECVALCIWDHLVGDECSGVCSRN